MTPRHIAVLDVGKTNMKLVLTDAATLREIRVLSRPNTVQPGPPYPHYDIEGIWAFLLDGLRDFQTTEGVDTITCSAHGASGVLLAADGGLAAPVLDYEHDGPDALAAEYNALRPEFDETGSPRLPRGLNLGAQLHWQLARDPGLPARVERLVTYPQYWTGRLSGVFATEVSSLGAHTDLWNPQAREFSSLVARLGMVGRMAPLRAADAVLGPVLPAVAAATGLSPQTPVFCGVHDSNASLYPHLHARPAPFAVVSTGTWVIAMAVGSRAKLDPTRDTLMNVNVRGDPVPSARFMGGREFEVICGLNPHSGPHPVPTDEELASVLSRQVMAFPAFEATSGPFHGRKPGWSHDPARLSGGEIVAAASIYLALMTATCLTLLQAEGPVIVEGPLGQNRVLMTMLSVACPHPILRASGGTGTAVGAALLAGAAAPVQPDILTPRPVPAGPWEAYAAAWHRAVSG
jgi:sugar (pentulose or hexulose) kinase